MSLGKKIDITVLLFKVSASGLSWHYSLRKFVVVSRDQPVAIGKGRCG